MKNLAGKVVIVADIDRDSGEAAARTVRGSFVRTDVSAAAAFAVATQGRLDVMVNNAGIECPQGPLHEVAHETWRGIIDINLGGVFFGMKYAIAQFMRQGGGGVVVNMSSVAGIIGFPNIAPYDAAKAAVCNLTRVGAVEYGPHRVRVNAVAPTAVATEMNRRQMERAADPAAYREFMETMNPLRGMPTPEDVAAAVAFLASDDAAFVSGAVLPVDGAYTAR